METVSAIARNRLRQPLNIQYEPRLCFLRQEERQERLSEREIGEVIGGKLDLDGIEIHGLWLGEV